MGKIKRKVVAGSKLNDPVLTHMREVAYGGGMEKLIRDTRKHSESMRDDEALLDKAEQKRQRKLERNRSKD